MTAELAIASDPEATDEDLRAALIGAAHKIRDMREGLYKAIMELQSMGDVLAARGSEPPPLTAQQMRALELAAELRKLAER